MPAQHFAGLLGRGDQALDSRQQHGDTWALEPDPVINVFTREVDCTLLPDALRLTLTARHSWSLYGVTDMHDEDLAGHARPHRVSRSAASRIALIVALLVITTWVAHAQMGSSSRPLSATVVSSYVTHNGSLALLVLWRGSPGWYLGSGAHGRSGGGGQAGRQTGWLSYSSGGHTVSVELDYSARAARILGQEVSLADTNVVLVDDVDGPTGGRILDRRWVDPSLPTVSRFDAKGLEADPVIAAMRRDPALGDFLQCEVPMPMPPVPAAAAVTVDPAAREQMHQFVQGLMTDTCRAAAAR